MRGDDCSGIHWKADAVQEVLEAGIGANGVPFMLNIQTDQIVALSKGFLKRWHRQVVVPQLDVYPGIRRGVNISARRALMLDVLQPGFQYAFVSAMRIGN